LDNGDVDRRGVHSAGFLESLKTFKGLMETALQVGLVTLYFDQLDFIGDHSRPSQSFDGACVATLEGFEVAVGSRCLALQFWDLLVSPISHYGSRGFLDGSAPANQRAQVMGSKLFFSVFEYCTSLVLPEAERVS
jgi:hypothetical protein